MLPAGSFSVIQVQHIARFGMLGYWENCLLSLLAAGLILGCSCCPQDLSGLTGEVVTREAPQYPSASLNRIAGAYDEYPSPCIIVFARDSMDVANAVRWAAKKEFPFRVRGRGNGVGAMSNLDDGLVIDVSRMRKATVDMELGTGAFGAGMDLHTACSVVDRFGYALPSGGDTSLGLVGLTLGGGFGHLSRKYGMVSDLLIRAEVVTSTGAIVNATASVNPDLFWGIRGGGHGSFGVVTELVYNLVPKPKRIALQLMQSYEVNKTTAVAQFSKWQEGILEWPDELMTQFQMLKSKKTGHIIIGLVGIYLGSQADLERLLAPIKSDFQSEIDLVDEYDNLRAIEILAGCGSRGDCIMDSMKQITKEDVNVVSIRSRFVSEEKPMSEKDIGLMVDSLAAQPAGVYSTVYMDSFGGAINKIPARRTAFPHRNMLWSGKFITTWDKGAEKMGLDWSENFYERNAKQMAPAAFINYADKALPLRMYYGDNLKKLEWIKLKWDPRDLFKFDLSIPVAAPNKKARYSHNQL